MVLYPRQSDGLKVHMARMRLPFANQQLIGLKIEIFPPHPLTFRWTQSRECEQGVIPDKFRVVDVNIFQKLLGLGRTVKLALEWIGNEPNPVRWFFDNVPFIQNPPEKHADEQQVFPAGIVAEFQTIQHHLHLVLFDLVRTFVAPLIFDEASV